VEKVLRAAAEQDEELAPSRVLGYAEA
jgi:hypothetical protein